tara:strand:- start:2489 stop:3583 length:1095 start_codon:yes stop_codon:yes gene_type:complete
MSRFRIELGTSKDDPDIRRILRENPMGGKISLALEREPNFFNSLSVEGRENQVVLSREIETEKVVGFGVRSIKPYFVNGEVIDLGYLGGLRLDKKYRNSTLVPRGYKFFRELDKDSKVPFYLTTIVEDNETVMKILESGKAGLPTYNPFGMLHTFVIKPGRILEQKHEIINGSQVSLENLLEFMNCEGKKKQFYPFYQTSDFGSERLRGLKQEDFYVAIEDRRIVGTLAKWDQGQFKQTRVVSYDWKTKLAQPFINFTSQFTNIPNLPRAGSLLHYFYAAFPTTKNNDPEILHSLLNAVSSDPQNQKYDYFMIGLSDTDGLKEAVIPFKPRDYHSIMYTVSFDKSSSESDLLNGRVPYLELGSL